MTSSVATGAVLKLGRMMGEAKDSFSLPLDALVQTFAIIGIRGSGKTSTAKVLAEQFHANDLKFIVLDPVGVWWGLRAGRDGKPEGGLPVVVFGGKHGDIPITRGDGARVARAIIESGIPAVIDLSQESKTTWRVFVTDFCRALMDLSPSVPWHIFIEEAAEFVPQKTKVAITRESKEAVERLVRLGRNQGYGVSIINQRPATVDKDVLEMCETAIMLRTIGRNDRKAGEAWLEPKLAADGLDEKEAKVKGRALVNALASFDDGTGYIWSPSWLKRFEVVAFNLSTTFHPGKTRSVHDVAGSRAATMVEVEAFTRRLRMEFAKASPAEKGARPAPRLVKAGDSLAMTPEILNQHQKELDDLRGQVAGLRVELAQARAAAGTVQSRLLKVREVLRPWYEAMRLVFEETAQVGAATGAAGTVDRAVYEPWLKKAGLFGCKRYLEVLIQNGRLTKAQLATLAGVNPRTARRYTSWCKRNGLVDVEGDFIVLRGV